MRRERRSRRAEALDPRAAPRRQPEPAVHERGDAGGARRQQKPRRLWRIGPPHADLDRARRGEAGGDCDEEDGHRGAEGKATPARMRDRPLGWDPGKRCGTRAVFDVATRAR
jgi:hypothetical protein